MSRPTCSVVIPSYNGRKLLETCLASVVRNLPAEGSVEVIVVDDASTDDTVAWISASYPEVRLVALAQNGGFCAAANFGIVSARGEFIQLLNNDTEVSPGWIEAGLKPFEDPTVGSVAPLVLVRSQPDRVDSAGDSYAWVGWPSKRGHGQSASLWIDRGSDRVFGASGSSAFYRASALERVGSYDPAFGSYYEDVDLAFRLRWGGYHCVYTPDCRILHDVSATYDHGRPALQRRMSRNAEYLFWTDLPTRTLLAALFPHLAFILAQGSYRTLRGRGLPFVQGKLDALRDWSKLIQGRKHRADIARSGMAKPHFPIKVGMLEDVRNHLSRPRETSAKPRGR